MSGNTGAKQASQVLGPVFCPPNLIRGGKTIDEIDPAVVNMYNEAAQAFEKLEGLMRKLTDSDENYDQRLFEAGVLDELEDFERLKEAYNILDHYDYLMPRASTASERAETLYWREIIEKAKREGEQEEE